MDHTWHFHIHIHSQKTSRVVAYLIQETSLIFVCEASHMKFAHVFHQILQECMYENVTYGPSQSTATQCHPGWNMMIIMTVDCHRAASCMWCSDTLLPQSSWKQPNTILDVTLRPWMTLGSLWHHLGTLWQSLWGSKYIFRVLNTMSRPCRLILQSS